MFSERSWILTAPQTRTYGAYLYLVIINKDQILRLQIIGKKQTERMERTDG